MYQVGICDDSRETCGEIEQMVLAYAKEHSMDIEIFVWNSGESLCESLNQESELSVLFLDIEMRAVSGIEAGIYIRNTLENRDMQIVYISSHTSYALQLFQTQPLEFLVKPVQKNDLSEVLKLAEKIMSHRKEKFQYSYKKEYFQIPYGDIMYFSSAGRKITIHLKKDEKKTFYGKLKELEKKLPSEFIAIHQSFLVNKNYIYRFTYEDVELEDGTKLAISQAHRKKVKESILKEG